MDRLLAVADTPCSRSVEVADAWAVAARGLTGLGGGELIDGQRCPTGERCDVQPIDLEPHSATPPHQSGRASAADGDVEVVDDAGVGHDDGDKRRPVLIEHERCAEDLDLDFR